jgi:hypothetical protein
LAKEAKMKAKKSEGDKKALIAALELASAPLTSFKLAVAQQQAGLIKDSCTVVLTTAENMIATASKALSDGKTLESCGFSLEEARHISTDMLAKTRTACIMRMRSAHATQYLSSIVGSSEW